MNFHKLILPLLVLILVVCQVASAQDFKGKTYLIPSEGGIELKAEFYGDECGDKPLILMFHQAGYSRGAYREIGPALNELGFCGVAIDQRSGNKVNGVINEAKVQAKKKGLKTDYVSALPDLKATLDYMLKTDYASRGVILVGSSYSASLIFLLASAHPEHVKGLVAFSPGEYFKYEGKLISDYATNIKCPVFISSARNENDNWEAMYANVTTEKTYYLPDFKGYHGAKALWSSSEGSEKYWKEFKAFLSQY